MPYDTESRRAVDLQTYASGPETIERLKAEAGLSPEDRARICARGADLVREIRAQSDPGLMEVFLAEYGLSTDEGIALMCLAEALLRVPDAETIDALIEDKIAPSDWGKHMGHSTSPLVNASTWALMLTGKVLKEDKKGPVGHLRSAIKRMGEPVIRTAVARAMKEMGRNFVLGENIQSAMDRAAKMEKKGFTYSYDMLGEAARTDRDATRYHLSYSRAISAIAQACVHDDIRKNPGISVKLSALHPRYELAQREQVMDILVPRLRSLALLAKSAGMGLNIDAEEADRLAISLDVIETVMSEPALAGWDGFGVVVQAYGQRAGYVLDFLYELAERLDRRIMVRLVKGAYWDTEIKQAQVEGVDGFPVFTSKAGTDVSYIANARKLLSMTDRIYPQFATHNAHTVAAVLDMATDKDKFEFQRLHGMGEALHKIVMERNGTNCRIYAPVGAHRDLLAYLVRRLLENGANSSFVNQIVDEEVAPEIVAADPFIMVEQERVHLPTGPELFLPERINSKGFDLKHQPTLDTIENARAPFATHKWEVGPVLAGEAKPEKPVRVENPADPADTPGMVANASKADVETALSKAEKWEAPYQERAEVLGKIADLYEENFGEIFAILHREAGKSQPDAVAELREAVDFLRYYGANAPQGEAVGTFTCISPWNFPLAIFTGQIAAALAAGNAVLSKPAEQTPIIAHLAVSLMHKAGVPNTVLQLLPGGGEVGAALTSNSRVDGVAFTGSTATAMKIRSAMAKNLAPGAPLIAETGGMNCMIVDSTALPEQAVAAIVESAFQSAGQRCSALRCLYVQEDIVEDFSRMLIGAMEALNIGMPWDLSTDCGPVIDETARAGISEHIQQARAEGRLIHELKTPNSGTYIAPTLIKVRSVGDLEREIFGPVLHMATFGATEIDTVIDEINSTGYGLTFGLMTRIDDRVQYVTERVQAGNIYVNRNQIGAIVGSQPFGGEGLSGTGPKAGGPHYLARFTAHPAPKAGDDWEGVMKPKEIQAILDKSKGVVLPPREDMLMPGPTGESNRLTSHARKPLLCMGPGREAAQAQARAVSGLGGLAVEATGTVPPEALTSLTGFSGALYWGDAEMARPYAKALSERTGPILPLITGLPDAGYILNERHVCVDTTAAGGNAALLGGTS
ncbi:L-proline dehydrogenase /delta-1-pyrroline-5-carboxylate dehydrogenase [Roseovarius nanhaiticus]|uniref:Bifunctional protein PutA n=1 Tax=Roseovarius nanhaiticus TaxID=573024 RepID=A0A1N7FE45_9RHOB|nr:bifunctional proline dehydrogenase/L-glutamate gamma-semialdehyde dehydrogenase PutA [Roseovarius nanhaiticus]SEK56613.1 L-proline dehydrogenase /delta-1-pyrroline-5-carboxylate dehydrogenase [Roseovarius nanhaiticus]SIR98601.1 L-proline dehydrogenase /delta-1-pyrroline-5-carboxylate dehydrogenase [Roseovarius nanhaiticus]